MTEQFPTGRTARTSPGQERELERAFALNDRGGLLGFAAEGPLTREQAASEAAYARHLEEAWQEEQARVAAGGRTLCPACGRRSVTHRSVATYGGGLPGSEYSDLAECEACSYRSL